MLGREIADSTISGDLVLVVGALAQGLRHHEAGQVLEGLWWWQYSYLSSWGERASAVLRVLAAQGADYAPFDARTMESYRRVLRDIAPDEEVRPETSNVQQTLAALQDKVPTLVVTCGAEGAVALKGGERAQVPSVATTIVDTTGAGDLFASGFLYGHVNGEPLERCLQRGAICAAEIISHYGARPEANLKALMTEQLG